MKIFLKYLLKIQEKQNLENGKIQLRVFLFRKRINEKFHKIFHFLFLYFIKY